MRKAQKNKRRNPSARVFVQAQHAQLFPCSLQMMIGLGSFVYYFHLTLFLTFNYFLHYYFLFCLCSLPGVLWFLMLKSNPFWVSFDVSSEIMI